VRRVLPKHLQRDQRRGPVRGDAPGVDPERATKVDPVLGHGGQVVRGHVDPFPGQSCPTCGHGIDECGSGARLVDAHAEGIGGKGFDLGTVEARQGASGASLIHQEDLAIYSLGKVRGPIEVALHGEILSRHEHGGAALRCAPLWLDPNDEELDRPA
jgi:hypothetical protein